MYIVIELQKNGETVGNQVFAFQTLAEAEARYHSILSAAAISTVEVHSAILLSAYGDTIKKESYTHGEA